MEVDGTVRLADVPTKTDLDPVAARAEAKTLARQIGKLQARLAAESKQALLVVFQAMDSGGKDGCIRRVFARCSPQGLVVSRFQTPTPEEWAHDFLWRAHKVAPAHGTLGVWNRSHYGGVVVERVMGFTETDWDVRYRQIRDFERLLVESGTRVVKIFLHISKDEQKRRLQRRLDDPDRRWKFDASDMAQRARWNDFQAAYEDALNATSTAQAPWHVIPADDKKVRDLLVSRIVLSTLESMDPQVPVVDGLPTRVD